ncbi:hypothetical protein H2200_007790 [Cladophialophora chaetospira]|uniref:Infection structure specific protein n=1 Tax=Cladophialophora chaetospira TaxID=386627 RepID=A0AA38X6F4_9EURO|nr:hypothetical protein H2200_007790 [Cladophialophora chaetospira]
MFHNILKFGALALPVALAATNPSSACPGKQQELLSSASEWPKPTGGVSSWMSSYHTSHRSAFSDCEDFTNGMPSSLSSPYQDWVTSVSEWSASFESMVSVASSTCLALVAPVVVAIPRCPNDAAAIATSKSSGSSATSASAGSIAPSVSSPSSASSSSGTTSLNRDSHLLVWAAIACSTVVGLLMIAL